MSQIPTIINPGFDTGSPSFPSGGVHWVVTKSPESGRKRKALSGLEMGIRS